MWTPEQGRKLFRDVSWHCSCHLSFGNQGFSGQFRSVKVWEFPFQSWLFGNSTQRRSLALFCALLHWFALFGVLAFALFCTLLRSFALLCALLRVSPSNRIKNNRIWEFQRGATLREPAIRAICKRESPRFAGKSPETNWPAHQLRASGCAVHANRILSPEIESPQMWVWPQLLFGEYPPSPRCNWRTLPSSHSPSLPTLSLFPHLANFAILREGVAQAGVGPKAQGGGGESPPSNTWGHTHIWGCSTRVGLLVLRLMQRLEEPDEVACSSLATYPQPRCLHVNHMVMAKSHTTCSTSSRK